MPAILKSIEIENFKSFDHVKLDLGQLNVVVGPNGSGKTNLLEGIQLAFDCINYNSPSDYPFISFWGYNNAVHNSQSKRPIAFKFQLSIDSYDVIYESKISGAGSLLRFIEENIIIAGFLELRRLGSRLTINYTRQAIDQINLQKELLKEFQNISHTFMGKKSKDPEGSLSPEVLNLSFDGIDESKSVFSFLFHHYILSYVHHRGKTPYSLVMHEFFYGNQNISGKKPFILIFPGVPVISDNTKPNRRDFISLIEYIVSFFSYDQSFLLMANTSGKKMDRLRVILVRHGSIYGMKEPVPLNRPYEGLLSGEGAISWLFTKFNENGGVFPEKIKRAMEDLFPNWQLGFRVTEDGNILLQVKEINPGSETLTLLTPSIPDGLFKLLIIMTAVEMRPSILLIDEIENSLHDSIIQYVMDSLRESGVTTIVTTHSPMVVDRSELDELRIIEKIAGESIIKSISNPVLMKKKLLELGITPSDSWLYGELV